MAIEWEKLAGVTLDQKKIDELKAHFDALEGQRDAAKQESIAGRKGKDKTIEDQKALIERLMDRVGITSPEEIDSLPDAKGQAEATKQLDAKLRRTERERDEAVKSRDEAVAKYAGERKTRAIAQALAKHPFIDPEDMQALVALRVKQEGDDFLYEDSGGKLVPIEDAVAAMAKTKPHLVRATGDGGGSGFKPGQTGQGATTMTRAAFEALPPAEKSAAAIKGVALTD